ncbi:MAG: hypothetical protein NVS4B11_10980 [Ktedonobacteraceae bacterium]
MYCLLYDKYVMTYSTIHSFVTLRWSMRFAENFASGTPIAMNKMVYVLGYHKVYAIDGSNGRIRWQLLNFETS